jgi:hypothetical protein
MGTSPCASARRKIARTGKRVADRRRLPAGREQSVDEALQVAAADLAEPCRPELGHEAQAQRLRVAMHGARFVDVAGPVPDGAGLRAFHPRFGRVGQRRRERAAHRSVAHRDVGLRTPGLGLGLGE